MAISRGSEIKPAQGKLGVLMPGMGAVSTTTIAGVEAVRRGLAEPIGSLTQLGTIRHRQADRNRTPENQRLCPARGPKRPGVRWLGHLCRRRIRSCVARGRTQQRHARADSAVPSERPSDGRRVRAALGQKLHGTHIKRARRSVTSPSNLSLTLRTLRNKTICRAALRCGADRRKSIKRRRMFIHRWRRLSRSAVIG